MSTSAPIEAVLFDFGGVFTESPFLAAHEAGEELGIDVDVAFDLCFGTYHDDGDHPWHRLERGEMTLEDARRTLKQMAAERGFDVDPVEFLFRLARDDEQREPIVQRALAIKATGMRTACVTNNILEFGDGWKSLVPVDELFDAVIDSCETGVRKPDPRIYRLALDAVDVDAEAAVFLDDHPANVAAAEAMGMRGIVVGRDRLAAFDQLEQLLARTE
ncbi:MAG: HAD family phosphatase [Acidimicrobiia bacterium]|nr:HAD family phosphatase [Acidimicrobiia bacterium]MBV9040034.1 HAD family phosphatase [Acidimicrobiia bacterium]MBV9284679.1 HAD family phosphatase [Acidimicrobiia bacterium]